MVVLSGGMGIFNPLIWEQWRREGVGWTEMLILKSYIYDKFSDHHWQLML